MPEKSLRMYLWSLLLWGLASDAVLTREKGRREVEREGREVGGGAPSHSHIKRFKSCLWVFFSLQTLESRNVSTDANSAWSRSRTPLGPGLSSEAVMAGQRAEDTL